MSNDKDKTDDHKSQISPTPEELNDDDLIGVDGGRWNAETVFAGDPERVFPNAVTISGLSNTVTADQPDFNTAGGGIPGDIIGLKSKLKR